MVSFLFWNINKKPLQHRIARLVEKYDIDVLMLAECSIDPDELLKKLNGTGQCRFCLPPSLNKKIRIFTRDPGFSLISRFDDDAGRLTIRQLSHNGTPPLLLAVVHLVSRVNWSREDQTLAATDLVREILRIEAKFGINHTLIVGDLNMNPFDPGVIGAQALHAVMTRDLARREKRIVQGRSYRFFYNPMWGHFGDRTEGPPGSFYLHSSKPETIFWHMYDQVLLRPSLMDALSELQILDTDGYDNLLTAQGLPRDSDSSDHLPLLFRLNI